MMYSSLRTLQKDGCNLDIVIIAYDHARTHLIALYAFYLTSTL